MNIISFILPYFPVRLNPVSGPWPLRVIENVRFFTGWNFSSVVILFFYFEIKFIISPLINFQTLTDHRCIAWFKSRIRVPFSSRNDKNVAEKFIYSIAKLIAVLRFIANLRKSLYKNKYELSFTFD